MKKNALSKIGLCLLAAAVILISTGGCRHLKTPVTRDGNAKAREAAAVYDLACTGMVTAGNTDEFAVALSSLDDLTGLDFSKEDPTFLIRAIRHGISLMEAADMRTKTEANKNRSTPTALAICANLTDAFSLISSVSSGR